MFPLLNIVRATLHSVEQPQVLYLFAASLFFNNVVVHDFAFVCSPESLCSKNVCILQIQPLDIRSLVTQRLFLKCMASEIRTCIT